MPEVGQAGYKVIIGNLGGIEDMQLDRIDVKQSEKRQAGYKRTEL